LRFVIAAALGLLTAIAPPLAVGVASLLNPSNEAGPALAFGVMGMFGLAFGAGIGFYVFLFAFAHIGRRR